MLLCNVTSLEPGMEVGGSVPHPRRTATELLRPGVTLDTRMINYLRRAGVSEVWVRHDATADLDAQTIRVRGRKRAAHRRRCGRLLSASTPARILAGIMWITGLQSMESWLC